MARSMTNKLMSQFVPWDLYNLTCSKSDLSGIGRQPSLLNLSYNKSHLCWRRKVHWGHLHILKDCLLKVPFWQQVLRIIQQFTDMSLFMDLATVYHCSLLGTISNVWWILTILCNSLFTLHNSVLGDATAEAHTGPVFSLFLALATLNPLPSTPIKPLKTWHQTHLHDWRFEGERNYTLCTIM